MIKSIKPKNKTKNSDKQLFLDMSNGEYKALNQLFNKYYMPLCQFGKLYENDSALVEEKISDVFIQLWNKRKLLKDITNPKPYLYVTVRHKLIKKKRTQFNFRYLDDHMNDIGLQEPSIEDETIIQEQRERVKQYLTQILNVLPKKSRRIFIMSRVEGFKYQEIAEIMGISPRTVETHVAIAIRYLSKQSKYPNH